jgi:NADPH:quinone reductase-like Zn-dependent oxidoreductase
LAAGAPGGPSAGATIVVTAMARGEWYASSGDTSVLGPVEPLELPGPGELRPDEVLLEVRCCSVGNGDEIAHAGGWDLGRHPPMVSGVEAAGVVAGTGGAVASLAVGDSVA